MTGFREEFVDQLETGAEALEDAGYDVLAYQGEIFSNATAEAVTGSGNTPQQAFDKTLEELDSDNRFFFYIGGDEFREAILGERDPGSLVYRNLKGIVEIDEPMTQPEWANEELPAFGVGIRYVPEQPNDHWEISTAETQNPYDMEDAQEYAERIVGALEEHGLEAEIGDIN
ncbi:hypothetical protein [Salinirussus salinus]|uniref:hypothetical protein n=1 Tax=Salinirussus salinus TaxID=1198300 RepID=UPI00135A68DC|nr:hypothetical protein [Salinirussus salinus]